MTDERPPFAIRAALQKDLESVQDVARRSWASAYEGIIPLDVQERAITTWYSTEALARAMQAPRAVFLVAECSEAVIGFVNLFVVAAEVVQLSRIYVLPTEQRRAVGTHLLNTAFACVGAEITTANVEAEERNYRGRAFYEKYGFRRVSDGITQMFGIEVPIVRYEKNIR